MSGKPTNPAIKPDVPAKTKKKLPPLPGQQKFSSYKDAMKSIEGTLGEMHLNQIKKGK